MQNVLIIGASSGIGLELARIYTATHRVVTIQRRPCPLPDVISLHADVTDGEQLETALQTALSYGVPSVAVYAAGFSMSAPFSETGSDMARKLFETNFWGYVRTLRLLLPLLPDKTRVVVLSSLASVLPIPYDPFYTASKSALNALTEALQTEYPKIRFLSVMVGGTRTDFSYKRLISPRTAARHDYATSALQYAEQHGMSPQSVAAGIALLCDFPRCSVLPTVGLTNRFLKFTARILPTRWKLRLAKLFFFGFPKLLLRTPYAPKTLSSKNTAN